MGVELDGIDFDIWFALGEAVCDVDVRVGNHFYSMWHGEYS